MMRAMWMIAMVGLLSASISGCGTTKTERGLSGGAIGAGVGAAGAAITGGNVAGGAALGGAAGAAAGIFTDEDDLNLGKPVWK